MINQGTEQGDRYRNGASGIRDKKGRSGAEGHETAGQNGQGKVRGKVLCI